MGKYKIEISYDEVVEAHNEIEAIEKFWESKNDININIDNFIDDITSIKEIEDLCLKCKKKKPIEYEQVGEGKYCQDCLDEENEIWEKEAGFEK